MFRHLIFATAGLVLLAGPAVAQGEPPPIPDANHFLCYPVRPMTFAARAVDLRDQFGIWHARVVGITRLCNPVEKRVVDEKDRESSRIVDERYHLVCYRIVLGTVERARYLALIHDQFSVARIEVTLPDELCLPAGKVKLGGKD